MTSVKKQKSHGRATRSNRGLTTQSIAGELVSYLPQTGAFASAVGVSRDTARAWMSGRVPARPRVLVLQRISALLRVCVAADRYIADRPSTGRWLTAKNNRLLHLSPAMVVQLHGANGAQLLCQAMPCLVPLMPAQAVDVPTLDELRFVLDAAIGSQDAIRCGEGLGVTLSDRELDEELAESHNTAAASHFTEFGETSQ